VFCEKSNSKCHVKLILEILVRELIQERERVEKSTFFTRNQRKYLKRNCRYFNRRVVFCFQEYFLNTLRTGAFKLFKYTFPGSKQFKSTFILCFFKNL